MKTLTKLTLAVLLLSGLFFISCEDHHEMPDTPKTYVLVHGAFQGAYVWKYVKAQLEAKGQKVVVVELPGHGQDQTPPEATSLHTYAAKVIDTINALDGKVILVGHSMGGMVITETAEKIPDRIEKLVYIAAFVPVNGQTLLGLSQTDSTSLIGPALILSADNLVFTIKPENVIPIFAQDANDDIKKLLLDNQRPEPSRVFIDTAVVTAVNWGKVDKYYVFTKHDHAVGPNLQKRMVAAAKIIKTVSIDSDHSPFLTQPQVITDLLTQGQ